MSDGRFVALLRGINVTGRNKIPMKDLKALAEKIGWTGVATYIQSGNVVFEAKGTAASLEKALEKGITERFGLEIEVIVRTAKEWDALIDGNPFPDEGKKEPARLLLTLSKEPPAKSAADALQERAIAGERIVRVKDALWVHFPQGIGKSKLTPALFDRLVGSTVTSRNWTTVLKIHEMLSN